MGLRKMGAVRGLAVFLLMLTMAGCAGAARPLVGDPSMIYVETGGGEVWELHRGADIRSNQALTVTPRQAWSVLSGVFDDLGVNVDVRDPSGMRMGATQVRFSGRFLKRSLSDFFDCGLDPGLNRPLADQMPISAQIITDVLAVGTTAELRTAMQGTARRSGGNAGVATCRSTGLLEVLIGEMVERRAAPPT